jgi:hypothetical protein
VLSLFRRVTRYPRGDIDPGENRLTECFAAVLERSDGLAAALVNNWLEIDLPAEMPVWVRTQRATVGGRFVDLELAFGAAAAPELRVWVEIKHGADTHENQLANYLTDIPFETQDAARVVLLAPRGTMPEAPAQVPRVEWQSVGRLVRTWCRYEAAHGRAEWLGGEFISYLREEGLMDGERLSAAHAFELEARPAAERTVARLMEIAQSHVVAGWGKPERTGGQGSRFGEGWWATFPVAAEGSPPAPTWRRAWFEWVLRDDRFLAQPRDSLAFFAGASFAAKGSAKSVAENNPWFAARAAQGFERAQANYTRLWRVMYPDQLLGSDTLDEQGAALGNWILDAFRTLAKKPPLA